MPKKLVFLKTEQDFANFKKSRKLVSANFTFRWHVPKNQNTPRFGFIVPKKTVRAVVDRNKIKRRVRAVLSKYVQDMKPVDVLFFPKPASIKLKFSDLETELLELFKKSGII